MLMAAGKGQPLVSLGVGIYKDPSGIAFAKPNRNRGLSALQDRLVGTVAGDFASVFFHPLLRMNNEMSNRIHLVQYSLPQIARQAFSEGRTSALVGNVLTYCSFLECQKNDSCEFVLPFYSLGWDTLGFSVIANTKYLQNNAKTVKAVMAALRAGFEFVIENPELSFALVKTHKAFKEIPPEVLNSQINNFVAFEKEHAPRDIPILASHRKDWVHTILLLQNYAGFVGKPEPENYYSRSYVAGVSSDD